MVENLEGEIWKDIEGYTGIYQVSNKGRVKSIKFQKHKILKNRIGKLGYHRIMLQGVGAPKQVLIHRLVMIAFKGHCTGMVVNHINGIRGDNRIENLNYCTNYENISIYRRQNKWGHIGIAFIHRLNKWFAVIEKDGKKHRSSVVDTQEQAIEDYKKLHLKIRGYEFTLIPSQTP